MGERYRIARLFLQALAALKKYRATVQRRGRDAIDNRCGYLIGFLKQYQDGVAVVGVPGNAAHQSRNAAVMAPSSEGLSPPNPATALSSSANGHATSQNGSTSRNAAIHGSGGPPQQATGLSSSQATAAANSGAIGNCHASGVRPISYLEAPVRKQLEKLFESGKDKAVLEDVGLIKQLARLGEEQALAALKNYKEASKHRRDINNKSAYLMGILRGYIEGTTPIAKAPWEGGTSEDGPDSAASSAAPAPPAAPGPGGNRTRGRGRGSGPIVDDAKRNAPPNPTPSPGVHGPPPPTPPPPQPPQPPAMAPAALALEMPRPRELGGFANAPVEQPPQQLQASNGQSHPVPLKEVSGTPSTSPMTSPPLGGGGLFLDGIGQNGVGVNPVHHTASTANQTGITGNADMYDPSNSLLYLDGGGGVNGFGTQAHPTAHQQPPRHASPHESLFGHSLSVDHQLGQQPQQRQTLVGPGLLGGDFLSTGGGIERGLVLGGTSAPAAAPVVSHAGGPRSHSNPGLFGSGLLAGDEFGSCSNGGLGNTVPASPGSGSGLGSTSGLGSSSLSGTGSGAESPLSSDAGNDVHPLGSSSSVAAVVQAGSLSMGGTSSYTGSTDWPSSSSPRSGEGRENLQSSSDDVVVSGMIDMLARLNLSKYVPVLAEAEVDMDALRLFGEVRYFVPGICVLCVSGVGCVSCS